MIDDLIKPQARPGDGMAALRYACPLARNQAPVTVSASMAAEYRISPSCRQ